MKQEGNKAAFAAGGGRTRIWCAGSSMTAAARDAERRIEARIAEQASSQNSPHRTHGWFFSRRRRLRIARCRPVHHHAIVRTTETGRADPACGPHAGGSGENTSDRNIEPEGRPFRAPGSQAPPRHRMTAPASTASTRRTGTRNAVRFRMNAATLSSVRDRPQSAGRTTDEGMTRRTRKTKRGTYGSGSCFANQSKPEGG